MYIDTHAHINFKYFKDDADEVHGNTRQPKESGGDHGAEGHGDDGGDNHLCPLHAFALRVKRFAVKQQVF